MDIKDLAVHYKTKDPSLKAFVDQSRGKINELIGGFNSQASPPKPPACVDVRNFGADGKITTNATAGIQAAISEALESDKSLDLASGIHRITAPINIDRLVDTTHKKFYVKSSGGAVLYVDSAIPMFSSTLTHPTAPQSENIEFQNVTFRVDDASRDAHVLDGIKFLRVSFNHCALDKI